MTHVIVRCLSVFLLSFGMLAHGSLFGQTSDARELLLEAEHLLKRNKPQDAIAAFKRADAAAENACHDCKIGLLEALNAAGAHKNAVEVAEALIKANPPSPILRRAYAGLGAAHSARGPHDTAALLLAEDAYRKALAVPDAADAHDHFGLGVVLLRMSRDEEGAQELKSYLKEDPKGRHAEHAQRLLDRPLCARQECAPAFSAVTTSGEYVSADALKGKVTLLHFWFVSDDWTRRWPAMWPEMRRLANRGEKEPFQVIGIAREPRQQSVMDFITANRITWPQCLDQAPTLYRTFGIDFLPTQIVVDHEGMIVHRSLYWSDTRYGEINKAVSQALNALKKAK